MTTTILVNIARPSFVSISRPIWNNILVLLFSVTYITWLTSPFTLIINVQAILIPLNPKFSKETSLANTNIHFGPQLWPMPSQWISSGEQIRYRVTVHSQIRASRKLSHCDIIRHNLDKYDTIVRNLIHTAEASSSSSTSSFATNTEQFHHHHRVTEEEPLLKEVYLFAENVDCSKNLYPQYVQSGGGGGGIQVHSEKNKLSDQNTDKHWEERTTTTMSDESYSIEVSANSAKVIIYARTIWGTIRALDTFSQMLYIDSMPSPSPFIASPLSSSDQSQSQNSSSSSSSSTPHPPVRCTRVANAVYINVSRVQDKPRFPYRSIMIDTGRHYLPPKLIIKNLDAMAYNKFNILHWHFNDDQSFPFQSKIFRNFSRLAAYSEQHIYRHSDIRLVVEEARLRGIQVILELDTPAHCHSLGKVFPNLLTKCAPTMWNMLQHSHFSSTIIDNSLDPSKEETYLTIERLLQEFRNLFPSKLIHLGIDDVSHDCWRTNTDIRKWMERTRLHSLKDVEQHYVDRLLQIIHTLNWNGIVYQDTVESGVKLEPDTIVQVWKDTKLLPEYAHWREYMKKFVQHNHTVVLSACWFLNIIRYGQDWPDLYACDPHDFEATEEEKRLVLGGEASLWGEYIDASNLMSHLWPRAAAVGEKLWSERFSSNNLEEVRHRLDAHRCRLLSRGIAAAPLQTSYCPYVDWSILEPDGYVEEKEMNAFEINNDEENFRHQTSTTISEITQPSTTKMTATVDGAATSITTYNGTTSDVHIHHHDRQNMQLTQPELSDQYQSSKRRSTIPKWSKEGNDDSHNDGQLLPPAQASTDQTNECMDSNENHLIAISRTTTTTKNSFTKWQTVSSSTSSLSLSLTQPSLTTNAMRWFVLYNILMICIVSSLLV